MQRLSRRRKNTVMYTILVLEMVSLFNNLYMLLCFKVSSRKFYDLLVILVCIHFSNYRLIYFHFRLVKTEFLVSKKGINCILGSLNRLTEQFF